MTPRRSSPRRCGPPTCWCRPSPTGSIEALLKQAGRRLKLIANFGNGVDNIDVAAAHARGITVTNTPKRADRRHRRHDHGADPRGAAAARSRARTVLSEGKRVARAGRRPGCWAIASGGKRLGIIGMGRIGQAVARRAQAFGLQIHYHNRKPRRARRSRRSWARPTGIASTRCWRAWTSSRSTARTRRRPSTCSRRGG